MWRRKEAPVQQARHRGRIFKDTRRGWWRYRCTDCDYGAGTSGTGVYTIELYIGYATEHARKYGPPSPV